MLFKAGAVPPLCGVVHCEATWTLGFRGVFPGCLPELSASADLSLCPRASVCHWLRDAPGNIDLPSAPPTHTQGTSQLKTEGVFQGLYLADPSALIFLALWVCWKLFLLSLTYMPLISKLILKFKYGPIWTKVIRKVKKVHVSWRTLLGSWQETEGTLSQKPKTLILEHVGSPAFIAVLFTTAKLRKQPACPSLRE